VAAFGLKLNPLISGFIQSQRIGQCFHAYNVSTTSSFFKNVLVNESSALCS
jgi:hypothetical protein